MVLKSIIIAILTIAISSCQKPSTSFQRTILSFGTQIEVTIYGVSQQEADQAILRIEKNLDVMHTQWHAWQPSSITKLNEKLQSGAPFIADPEILPLIKQSQQLYTQSQGLFNPAVGKLIELWGFYKNNPEKNKRIPSKEAIQQLLDSNPNMLNIIVENDTLTGTNKDLQLDLGGYAKGFGVDKLVEQLRAQGINNALINAGGDIRGIGNAGDRSWKIAIQHPLTLQALGWLELEDECIFTSGDYLRRFIVNGKSYHHIINPKTGYPSTEAKAVTVIHASGAIADAAATALMVASPEQWLSIAKSMGLKHLLVVDNDGQLYSDQVFADRLHLNDKNMSINLLGRL